jgi:mRNA-degrading endonuclease RelE of RelBE toxin-antitoxin system
VAYKVLISKRAKRDLANLPVIFAKEITTALRALAARTLANADIKKLQGIDPPKYRLRVGNYRAIYRCEGSDILVLRVMDRKEAYR